MHVMAVIVHTSLWKLINTVIIGGMTPALGVNRHTLSLVICGDDSYVYTLRPERQAEGTITKS